ncbi:MAG: tetratricopeptide repeat protein [Saprospiraceae bacterium]|nr:tetratricopeptide repeat protein [Saprospiraceae bacterium]
MTLVFASHPVHTEVVANIKGRDEILVLLGGIWSLYFSLRYLDSGKLKLAILSGLCMFFSLLAKENALAFVAVIPLTIFFYRSNKAKDLFRSWIPLLLATLFYLVIRFSVLGFDLGGDAPRELMNNPFLKLRNGFYEPMPLFEKAPLIIYGLLKYVQLLFFPHPLTHDYYPKVFEMISWSSLSVMAAILIFLAVGMIIVFRSGKWKIVSFSMLFFVFTIFLTSNILFPIGTHLSERFLFTPSLAFALLAASGWFWIYQKKQSWIAWLLLGILVSLYSAKSIARSQVWKSNYTLFTTDVVTSGKSAKVQNAAGGEMIARAIALSDTLARNQQIRQAMVHLKEAIRIHPGYKNAYLLIGNGSYYLQEYEHAIKFYDHALKLDPTYQEAFHNRALAYRDLGRYLGETMSDLTGAIEFLEKAYAQLQDDYETNRLLGIAYGNQGQSAKAISYFKKALTFKTDDAWTNYNLGLAYLAIQDSINAHLYIDRAKTLNPQVGN